MKFVVLLAVVAIVLSGCTSGGRFAPTSAYSTLRLPWQKRAEPPPSTRPAATDPAAARPQRSSTPIEEPEAAPVAAPRETVISEPAPPPPKRS